MEIRFETWTHNAGWRLGQEGEEELGKMQIP